LVSVLVKNWDVFGDGRDNILIDKNGELYSIDHGGAFRHRARSNSGLKPGTPYGDDAKSEYESLKTKNSFGILINGNGVEISTELMNSFAEKINRPQFKQLFVNNRQNTDQNEIGNELYDVFIKRFQDLTKIIR
jgi:hypothetical protein